jgi:hypothetical protein
MGKKEKPQESIQFSAGNVTHSSVAVGTGAYASNINDSHRDLIAARELLTKLSGLLEEEGLCIDHKKEIRDDVLIVQGELDKDKPNLGLTRSALKGIVASLGPVQALASLAAQVLTIVHRIG